MPTAARPAARRRRSQVRVGGAPLVMAPGAGVATVLMPQVHQDAPPASTPRSTPARRSALLRKPAPLLAVTAAGSPPAAGLGGA